MQKKKILVSQARGTILCTYRVPHQ
uniref:Uncharacterized protein n=1 Tax=Anguilla anguilla TaxID=7936 RepID=A0A0E9U9D1_ANGAN